MNDGSNDRKNHIRNYTQENQALDEIAKEAEARLAAKRLARFEARALRMREINNNSIKKPQYPPSLDNNLSHQINEPTEEEELTNGYASCESLCHHNNDDNSSAQMYDSNLHFNQQYESEFNHDYDHPVSNSEEIDQDESLNHSNSNRKKRDIESNEIVDSNVYDAPNNGQNGDKIRVENDLETLIMKYEDLEKKYNSSLISNAELSNEIESYKYQIETLKDDVDDFGLKNSQLERDSKREHNELLVLRKLHQASSEELKRAKEQIIKRDQLIINSGMVIVDVNETESYLAPVLPTNIDDNNSRDELDSCILWPPQILLTTDTISILRDFSKKNTTSESLDSCLRILINSREDFQTKTRELEHLLVQAQIPFSDKTINSSKMNRQKYLPSNNSSDTDTDNEITKEFSIKAKISPTLSQNIKTSLNANKETQTSEMDIKETRRKLLEYEYKLQRYEQELTTMTANLERSEANCERQKKARETVENSESEFKAENRKLKRELRDTKQNVEEYETKIGHLERRLEKMRSSRLNSVMTEIS
ncbi:unnamed protein product [Gordionus sp. m RMFG-2023]|uniref:leucine-rich repeat flightless-interacting protein 2-like n=1 Tax=Gordionus sp. m RMFG-2023 TaxID=3053472 RepID=UPI0030DE3E9B